jgi:hypothetical protein
MLLNLNNIFENLAPTCGRPTGIDTLLSHSVTDSCSPTLPLTADVVYWRHLFGAFTIR